jgi:hypothetical protein
MAKDAGPLVGLLRWAGMALVVAGVLMVVATLLHPSRETATTIIGSEVGLVAAHVLYTLSWLLVLLGLPGLCLAQRDAIGQLGLVGFLTAFLGTYLIAVTGNFGFLAPVLAKESPAVLDSINQYTPVVAINGLAAITFMVGFALFGIAMIRTASLPHVSGILVAVGAPAHLLGFGIAQFISPIFWVIAILGSLSLGTGLPGPATCCGGPPEHQISQLQTTRPLHAIERLEFLYSALHGTAIRHAAEWLDLTTSPSEPFGGSPKKQAYFRQCSTQSRRP